jgi:hypothetical protein
MKNLMAMDETANATIATAKCLPDIFTLNRSGGVGKTTVTEIIYSFMKNISANYQLITVDSSEDKNALTNLNNRVKDSIPINIPLESVTYGEDGQKVVKAWHKLAKQLGSGSIVDFGANLSDIFLGWLEDEDVLSLTYGEAGMPWLVVPVTTKTQSIQDAMDMFEYLEKVKERVRFSKIFVVLNEVSGSFSDEEQPVKLLADLKKAGKNLGVEFVLMPKCRTEVGTRALFESQVSIASFLKLDRAGWEDATGFDKYEANRTNIYLKAWIEKTTDGLLKAGFSKLK